MAEDLPRSRAARRAAESALVSVVHHYGARPEFVLLGGLVPELLCARTRYLHAGTTDVDVQLNLEIACGVMNAVRLEKALLAAKFTVDKEHVWRWSTGVGARADGDQVRTACQTAMMSHRTRRFSSRSARTSEPRTYAGRASQRETSAPRRFAGLVDNTETEVEINVAGLGGYLFAKTAAAQARSKTKD